MRFVSLVAVCACVLLTACGSSESGQANNAQGNISADSRAGPEANSSAVTPSNAMAMVAAPLTKNRALAVMHERHEGMETIGKTMKELHRTLAGGSPDLATVRSDAAKIAGLSQKASGWFPAGTGPDVGKTGAKPAIWQNREDFASKLRNFQAAARTFNATAAGNDVAAIKARYADLGGACKACHDKYRTEMKH